MHLLRLLLLLSLSSPISKAANRSDLTTLALKPETDIPTRELALILAKGWGHRNASIKALARNFAPTLLKKEDLRDEQTQLLMRAISTGDPIYASFAAVVARSVAAYGVPHSKMRAVFYFEVPVNLRLTEPRDPLDPREKILEFQLLETLLELLAQDHFSDKKNFLDEDDSLMADSCPHPRQPLTALGSLYFKVYLLMRTTPSPKIVEMAFGAITDEYFDLGAQDVVASQRFARTLMRLPNQVLDSTGFRRIVNFGIDRQFFLRVEALGSECPNLLIDGNVESYGPPQGIRPFKELLVCY